MVDKRPPRFSIAIPVYNRSHFLRQAITSCFAQTETDFEVIVSDDCSSEDLLNVVRSFGDSRIAYYRSESRLGACANHQKVVSLSTGAYVINLHSDDMLLPNCLEVAGRELDRRTDAAAAYFACTYLENGRVGGSTLVPAIDFADAVTLMSEPWLEHFHGIAPSCCLFRKRTFERIGGYRTSLRLAYDWDLYMRFLTLGGGVIFIPRILSIGGRHSDQSVQTTSIDGLWDMLDLWSGEYRERWSARTLAGLVSTQCGMKLRRGEGIPGVMNMFREIWRRKLAWRLLGGMSGALWDKARNRVGVGDSGQSEHYIEPINRDIAVEQANSVVSTWATTL
jgi:glycosyltransferase involved in cell wall biosynthesis